MWQVAALLGLPVSYFGFVLEQVVLLAYGLLGKPRAGGERMAMLLSSRLLFFHTLVFPGI